jgi:hypothetical protein
MLAKAGERGLLRLPACKPVCVLGLKPLIARVGPDVRLPSIRWHLASLILHAHYAGIFSGSMPHL